MYVYYNDIFFVIIIIWEKILVLGYNLLRYGYILCLDGMVV